MIRAIILAALVIGGIAYMFWYDDRQTRERQG